MINYNNKNIIPQFQEGWNVPPDTVFDGAMDILAQRKRRKKGVIFFFGLIIILSVGTIYTLSRSQIEHNEIVHTNILPQSYTGNNASINEKVNPVHKDNNSFIISPPQTSYISSDLDQIKSMDVTALPLISSSVLLQTENITRRDFELIQTLSTPTRINYFNKINIALLSAKEKTKDHIIKLGLHINHNESSFSMANIPENAPLLTKYDQYYSSFGLKANLDVAVNKRFSVLGSIEYAGISNCSEISNSLTLEENNIYIDGQGNTRYASDMNVETPLGGVNTRSDLSLNTVSGSEIDYNSKISQSLKLVSFSIGIKYNLWKNNDWAINTEGGIGYNHIFNNQTNVINDFRSPHGEILGSSESDAKFIKLLNKNFLDARLGLNISYRLNEHFYINAGSQYNQSISSLRSSRNIKEPTTYLHKWNSQIGILFGF